jgi:hypothetical protein
LDSCADRSTAISPRVRLFRLFLLIPCWESQRLIPKRSAGPRATKIGVVSLKALDHHRPNREESAVLALNYPPPDRTVARRSSLSKYRRTYESQQTVITATAGHLDHLPVRRIGDDDRCVTLEGPKSEPVESSRVGRRLRIPHDESRHKRLHLSRAGFWALSPIEQVFAKPSGRAVGSSASPIDPRCLRTPSRRSDFAAYVSVPLRISTGWSR